MRILLIYPYSIEKRMQEDDISVIPMGVYYIAALLKENHYHTEILNFYDQDKSSQLIRSTIADKKPDVIGFSILHANRWGGIEIAQIAKEIYPGVKIVFGGIGATFLWNHLLTHFKSIDFIITGEGEYPFLNLIRCIESKEYGQIKDIKGLAFREKGKIIKNLPDDYIREIDSLPNPAKYFVYQHLSLTRGCPGNCTFCGSPKFWGRKVRFHSSSYFVDQVELLYKKGVTFFYFSDDTFTLKKDLVIEICKKILERNIQILWAAISRVDYINDELLFWMKKAGCIQISFGVESGSEKIRNLLNKNIENSRIKKAFRMTIKYGILARAYFIYGCPGETWDTIRETTELIKEIKPLGAIFYILDLFPGTSLYEDFKKEFKITDDIWLNKIEGIMYFENDERLSRELVVSFGNELKKCFYENIQHFADQIELVDIRKLYSSHSNFYSRLAMTFSHGDYSRIDAIKNKENIAEKLFEKSLHYYPDHTAYLGLGIIKQKKGKYEESEKILSEGLRYYSDSEHINMCLGLSLMNLKKYPKAILCFQKFQNSKDALLNISNCYKAMGDVEKENLYLKKLRGMQ